MIIGTFIYDKATDSFSGDISTLHFQFSPVEIAPANKKSEKGPDYRLVSQTAHGQVELGSAWKRTSQLGRAFISVELDAPLLDKPLNAALFLAEKGTSASLFWSRKKAKAEVTEPKPKQSTKKAA